MKSIIILAALSSAIAYADTHANIMRNVSFTTERSETYQTEAGELRIDYRGMSYEYNSNVFLHHAQRASRMMPDFLEQQGVTGLERCRDQSINVYDVETQTLNQNAIYETVNWGDPNRQGRYGSDLLGLYDKGDSARDPATIYTDIELYFPERIRIISHEMAHFWYDQYCLSTRDINSEELAQAFETFYRENSRNRKYGRPY
jgi:hypothetical protein